MKNVVVKLNSLEDKVFGISKVKQNPMQAVSSISGIVSMEKNIKDYKITIIGDVDPVRIVKKLKKWNPVIETVSDVKEEKKEDKKPAGGDKKPAGDDKKPADDAKPKEPTEQEKIAILVAEAYSRQFPHHTQYYSAQSSEENPNACVIC